MRIVTIDDYQGEELIVICVLKGSFMFCSDLIKKIQLPIKMEFIALSSYGDGMSSTGNVKLEMDVSSPIAGKNVLIVEDIDAAHAVFQQRRSFW